MTLTEVFPPVWIAGEVQRVRQSQAGHLYFELVEKGEGDRVVAKLEGVVWRSAWNRVRRDLEKAGQPLAEGQEIRCLADVDFYGPFGRLQIVVREIDVVYGMGMLERRRRETLAALEAAGLLGRNGELELAPLPLDLALITSEGSAAYHDFVSTLEGSGYGYKVTLLHSAVQGKGAEPELLAALSVAGRIGVDAVVVIRGGGSRTDLAAFDSRAIAEAIAHSPVPVLTGLGHQTDESIADRVAHRPFKTPTGVGEFLVERVREQESRVNRVADSLRRQALVPIRRSVDQVDRASHRLLSARRPVRREAERLQRIAERLQRRSEEMLRSERRRMDGSADRLAGEASRAIARRSDATERLAARLVPAARARVREAEAVVSGWERLVEQISPARLLARGFSVTRNSEGRAVLDPAELAAGELVETEVAGGRFRSKVEP